MKLPDDDIVHHDNLQDPEERIDTRGIDVLGVNWFPPSQFFNEQQARDQQKMNEWMAVIRFLQEHGYSPAQIENVLLILKL